MASGHSQLCTLCGTFRHATDAFTPPSDGECAGGEEGGVTMSDHTNAMHPAMIEMEATVATLELERDEARDAMLAMSAAMDRANVVVDDARKAIGDAMDDLWRTRAAYVSSRTDGHKIREDDEKGQMA